MHIERHTFSVTTDASGDGTGYSPAITGRVLGVFYTKDGTTPYDNTADITVTAEATGEAIWTQSNVTASAKKYPRVPVQDEAGADATLNGTEKMRDAVHVAKDRIKVVVAQGGNTKTGSFTVIVG